MYGSFSAGGVVGGGHLYVSGRDARLYALNPDTGATDWSSPVAGSYMPGTPVYDPQRNQVYVTMSNFPDGKLYAFRATDGALLWTASTGGQWSAGDSTPLIMGDTVITAANGSGTTLYGFDAATGKELWRQRPNGGVVPAASGDKVLLGYVNGQVFAYQGTTGAPAWSRTTGWSGGGRYMAAAAGGKIYIADNWRVTALNETDGSVAWERTSGLSTSSPGGAALADGVLWVPQYGGVAALDANNGDIIQRLSFCSSNASVPVVSSTHVYVPCGGKIYAVDRTTRAVAAMVNGRGPLALDGNRLYYLSTYGSGYRFAAGEAGPSAVETHLGVAISGPVQYSDPVNFTATLTRKDGTPVSGATVQFAIGGPIGTAVTDEQGKATLTWTSALSAGAYKLTVTYAGDKTANLAGASAVTDLTVMPEVAVIQKVGPDLVSIDSGNTIPLNASLAEEADGSFGKLDTAVVSFRVLNEAQTVVATAVAPVMAAGDGTGTANASIAMLPEGVYTIEAEVQSWGLYVAAHVATPLLVDAPVDGNRVSGGGWLQQDGLKSTFGLNVGQSRSDGNVKGSLLYMFHDKASQRLLKVQVRQWDNLAVVGSQAVATGTGTVRSVEPVHSKAREYVGVYSVQLAVSDGGDDAPDVFELTVRDSAGEIFYQVKGLLDGGDLMVVSP